MALWEIGKVKKEVCVDSCFYTFIVKYAESVNTKGIDL